MKRAFLLFAAAVISTAALADGPNPYVVGTGSRIESTEDDDSASRGSGFMGGGYRSGLLTGSDDSSQIGTGGRTVSVGLEHIR